MDARAALETPYSPVGKARALWVGANDPAVALALLYWESWPLSDPPAGPMCVCVCCKPGDGDIDISDRGVWYEQRPIGDSNGDGVFDSADLVTVFQAGRYNRTPLGNTTFQEGDWNADGSFDSRDFVFAFQFGTYLHTPPA